MAVSVPALGLLAVLLVFEVFCLYDLAHVRSVRYLPKWGWLVVCLVSVPLGGIVYLAIGREP